MGNASRFRVPVRDKKFAKSAKSARETISAFPRVFFVFGENN